LIEVAIDAEISRWSRVLDHISGRVNALRAVTPLVMRLPKSRVAGEVVRLSRLLQLDEQTVSREVLSAVSTASRRTALPRSPTDGTDRPPPRLEL
jgi:hypothetical protein